MRQAYVSEFKPHEVRCTRYNIMWSSLSVTWDRSVVSPGTPVFPTNTTDRHDITVILLKVVLNTIALTLYFRYIGIMETTE